MRICIVDDHEVVRAGLKAALNDESGVEVVAEAASAHEALDLLPTVRAQVVLTDFRLPDLAGDELCRRITSSFPEISVVVLTTFLNEEIVRDCYDAGAAAFVTKSAGLDELREVLARIARGGQRPTEGVSATVERLFKRSERPGALTPRQEDVLVLVTEGLTYDEIAAHLSIGESTVRFHVQSLKSRLGARSRTDLVRIALSRALIAPSAIPRPTRTQSFRQ